MCMLIFLLGDFFVFSLVWVFVDCCVLRVDDWAGRGIGAVDSFFRTVVVVDSDKI